jgi:signal peptidase I
MAEAPKKSASRDTLESLVVTVILAIFGTTFILQAFKIPTGSMENTLLIGDHLLVNKFCFAHYSDLLGRFLPYREIRRDDIVVFKYPPSDDQTEPGEHFVKRVVGIPGDRIRVAHRQLYVNGKQKAEPFVHHTPEYEDQIRPGDDFPPSNPELLRGATLAWSQQLQDFVKDGELVVPPGRYFVMGDNREQSWDSRFWGFVPRELVSGRPVVIYWSFETPRDEFLRNSLGDRLRQTGDLIFHFLTKTRWSRTLALVR